MFFALFQTIQDTYSFTDSEDYDSTDYNEPELTDSSDSDYVPDSWVQPKKFPEKETNHECTKKKLLRRKP